MNHIDTGAMILPGPKVGGKWDAIVRDCARAMQSVKPGTHWIRRDDPMRDDVIAAAVNARFVVSVEPYTLELGGQVGARSLALAKVIIRVGKRDRGIRADRFLREFVEVRL
jgi:hypothetical protein